MFKIGAHLSASKGYVHMYDEALSIGGSTFQFFTRNPRGGKAKELDMSDISLFNEQSRNNFGPILAHAPYTLNACSADEKIREFAHIVMEDDLQRLEHTPGAMYNFHPGSHVGQGVEEGIKQISSLLNAILFPGMKTLVLLETMAGKGSEVGSRFEELKEIIDQTNLSEYLGVCLDTCHVYDAGYDIVHDLDNVLSEFDRIIGLDRLKAVHLNDTKNPFASHKDRHEKIGEGFLGIDAIKRIINHPRLSHLPFFLETPNDVDGYAKEISLLKSLREG